ncbi:hypothetical protein LOTGIDRAFT_170847 [Lottia gigantea]|uniref:CARD domain-containing protein n=1 Tax=Lottia gigantea TaxID=225164 RepID=V4BEU0_LOTGI|nr:hypothetical protein LOTGIDRAFT_170847 [Lottia gigantea]ESP04347.1 hypothetical protein LOTGIDRAFT_170847 [Lottia gigantea]
MNPKQKEVLQTHRNFVIKNIIWNDQLAELLKSQGLVTDSILTDINKQESRDEKVKVLLERLVLKAGQAYHKFCNVLQVTGHYFLADFLRDEETNETANVKDLVKRLPFLGKVLKDNERKLVESYVIEKIQSETLKYIWKNEAREKDKALDAKLKQLETEVLMKEKSKDADSKINELKGTLMTASEECVVLKAQINALKAEIPAIRKEHQEDLNKQVKFNMANENSLKKVTEKFEHADKAITRIRLMIREAVTPRDNRTEKPTSIPKDNLTYLMDDLEFLISEFRQLMETESKYEELIKERDWVLVQLGFNQTESPTPSLTQAFKSFITQNQAQIDDLKTEIDKYDEMLRTQTDKMSFIENAKNDDERKVTNSTAVWQAAIMSVMRRQLQDVKVSNRKKDSNILFLEEDIKKLKDKIAKLENTLEEQKENNVTRTNVITSEDWSKLRGSPSRDQVDTNFLKSIDSVNAMNGVDVSLSDSSVGSKPERQKLNALPPLKYPTFKMNPGSSVARILKVRPQASMPRKYESRPIGGVPEGLHAAQLHLESRRGNQNIHGNGLSELKSFARDR